MPGIEVVPLTAEHRPDCAGLLAARFERQRAAEPLLPELDDFAAQVPEAGMVAIRGGRLVAYVAGEVQGDVATVGFGGCAALVPDAVRDCFAAAAAEWGVRRFSVAVPTSDVDVLDAWFRLAFGCQFYWAVRPTEPAEPIDFGGTIRPSTPDDLEQIAEFDRLLYELQALSPSFSDRESPHLERTAQWRSLWDDPDFTDFVAERHGRIVGHALLYRRPTGDLRVPDANIDLAHVVTAPDVRGTGVGRALTENALTYAFLNDHRSVTVDWRSVNLLASRFWPRRGFRPQYLRLYRAVP